MSALHISTSRHAEYNIPKCIQSLRQNEPVLFMDRQKLRSQAQRFISGFPGTVLFAVKSNPAPTVIRCLAEAGINDFDVASPAEMHLVRRLIPQARLCFNHPVKEAQAIKLAFDKYMVRDFVVDCREELDKLVSSVSAPSSLVVQVRIKTTGSSKVYDFSQKFGATPEETLSLIRLLQDGGIPWALCFHVGSQCESPDPYLDTICTCKHIVDESESLPRYINVGGGFPVAYTGKPLPFIEQFFDIIAKAKKHCGLPPLLCEPGRAMVAAAGTLVTKVVLRKGNRLYLNDGVYGALGEINYLGIEPEAVATGQMRKLSETLSPFQIYGRTCDSFDYLDKCIHLPNDINIGDSVLFANMGAYSCTLSNRFNGFRAPSVRMMS